MTSVTCSGSFYSDFARLFTNSLSSLGIDWACYNPLDLIKPGLPLFVDFSKVLWRMFGRGADNGRPV